MKKSKLLAVMLGAVMIPTTLAVVGCGTPPPALDLQGEGTQANPYLIATAADLDQITKPAADKLSAIENKYFMLTENIGSSDNPYQTTAEDFNAIFDGILLGGDKTITMAGDTALFAENEGTIQNLTIAGNVNADTATGVVGMLANKNEGTIKNVNVGGEIVSTRGTVSDLASAVTNGVGGLVGLNDTTGKIEGSYSEANVQAKVGAGGFAAINKGEIKNSFNEGIIGMARPGKTAEDATWLSNTINYSVMGGIAGINFGSILATQNKSFVFAPALNTSAQDYESTMVGNDYIGGIAGYNEANATISECSNMYGSKNNPFIVFGDEYVGSIAGANEGAISFCLAGQQIGARAKLGGITSTNNTTGTVKNCAVTANQAAPDSIKISSSDSVAKQYWYIADTAENCAYNESSGRGAVPETADAYTNCVTGLRVGSDAEGFIEVLNAGLTAGSEKWFYSNGEGAGGNGDPTLQPVANLYATITAHTGLDGAETTVYKISKFNTEDYTSTPNGKTPTGYTHIGWSLTPNGTQTDVILDGEDAVFTWTLTAGQNIVVYAVYTQNPVE